MKSLSLTKVNISKVETGAGEEVEGAKLQVIEKVKAADEGREILLRRIKNWKIRS